jgi:preprotein translocase subunit SecE
MANAEISEGRTSAAQGENLGTGIRAIWFELRRVVWPTRQELIRMTIVVVVTVITIATFIAIVDALLQQVFKVFYGAS